ncbi:MULTISPECIES: UbiA family prenyltransferase [Amycolatopsis]|uniref:4-hydroxybenzoate polyprenyltransferase n=1 Tax=Amycolatopsis dongchuanensis TaxID=1070866 RepID=A0ABP8VMM9_9PSEU
MAVRERLVTFYGFSRGTQALLSVAQPLTVALLAPGHPPVWRFVVLAVASLAAFASVIALNDLLDTGLDRQRRGELDLPDIESAGGRHPLAQGRLSLRAGVTWVAALGLLTVVLLALLGRVCVVLFFVAAVLEVAYCLLATATCGKTVVSGIMVAGGGWVGWFAMTGEFDPLRLGLVALWLAAWEIGGRNIPNDLADVDEDARLGIRTVPVVFGARTAAAVAAAALTVAAAAVLALLCYAEVGPLGIVGAVLALGYTVFVPARRLLRRPDAAGALAAFNRASFHPPVILLVTVVFTSA